MLLLNKKGSPSIRVKRQVRSLMVEYPREEKKQDVLAILFNRHSSGMTFKLPILNADSMGLEIKLPLLLTGMFYLKIVDGDMSILSQIALQ